MTENETIRIAEDSEGDEYSVSPFIDPTAQFAGQITFSGVKVQGDTVALDNGVYIKALAANSGKVYLGGSTVTTSGYSFELSAGDVIPVQVDNLNHIYFISDSGTNKICWIKA